MDEFAVIRRYFMAQAVSREDVQLGIGDDAAVLKPPPGRALVATTDALLSGVHFPTDTRPHAIGHKALAVNLSDLAAMGAEPAWATLALTLPEAAPDWLAQFCAGFFELARLHEVQLVGGDLTRGPLTVGVQVIGFAATRGVLTRGGAGVGDDIYVSGCLAAAALGLACLQGELDLGGDERAAAVRRLEYPEPRLGLGAALVGIASAAIDVSDGLAADLGHILASSAVAGEIWLERLPLVPGYQRRFSELGWGPAVVAGDDYELCFTAAPERRDQVQAAAAGQQITVTRVGCVSAGAGLSLQHQGRPVTLPVEGYRHFTGG